MLRFVWTAVLVLALCSPVTAFAERKCDFSDLNDPILQLPYPIVEFSTYQDGWVVYQVTRVSEPYENVVKVLMEAKDKRTFFSGMHVLGMSLSAMTNNYTAVLALNNEHHYLTIKRHGTGTEFVLQATPNSYVSSLYQKAIFGYRLSNEAVIPIGLVGDDGL